MAKETLTLHKLNEYWKTVEDPFYYDPVISGMRSTLDGVTEVTNGLRHRKTGGDGKWTRKSSRYCEFTTTSRILGPGTAAKPTE